MRYNIFAALPSQRNEDCVPSDREYHFAIDIVTLQRVPAAMRCNNPANIKTCHPAHNAVTVIMYVIHNG
jgi:hypothetical protein